jgi:hypothetical protein
MIHLIYVIIVENTQHHIMNLINIVPCSKYEYNDYEECMNCIFNWAHYLSGDEWKKIKCTDNTNIDEFKLIYNKHISLSSDRLFKRVIII